MDTIKLVQAIVEQYPELSSSIGGGTITVDPADDRGFSVWLRVDELGKLDTIGFDGWHEIE